MVTGHESGLAKLYRRVYPIATIVILIFEAWVLVIRLQNSGLKLTEYIFILIWVLAAAGDVLLLVMKAKAHSVIALLVCILVVFSILPAVGYHALPVKAQVNRIETLIVNEGMLYGNKLTPADSEPNQYVRAAITDAIDYLVNANDAKLPTWFYKDLGDCDVFKTKLGFEKTWIELDGAYNTEFGMNPGTYLSLPSTAVDISGYSWAVNLQNEYGKDESRVIVDGNRGTYQIYWTVSNGGIPSIKILLDDRLILKQDLNNYIDVMCKKYPPGQAGRIDATLEDMSLRLETVEVNVFLVFSNIEISIDTTNDTINYWVVLKDLYLSENS